MFDVRFSPFLLLVLGLLLVGTLKSQAQSFVYTNFQSAAPISAFVSFTVITNIPPPHTPITIQSTNAPSTVSGYQFTHWTVANLRMEDVTGRAANPVSMVMSNANLTAIANYVPVTQDTGSTGIPDWYRLEYYGTTDIAPTSDSDEDEIDLKTELFRGYHPRVKNELVEGGVSRRRSETITLILNTNFSKVFTVSEPAGITNGFAVVTNTGTINLPAQIAFTGYEFIGWFTNNVRADNPQGFSLGSLPFTITNELTFVAKFIVAGVDSDTDGMTDGYELYNFNTLGFNLTGDPDGDGIDIKTEQFRSYSPQAFNNLEEGGISRRRSETLVVITSTNYSRVSTHSDPAGITNGFSVVSNTTSISLPAQLAFTGYGFIGWFNGPDRVDSPQGFSLGNLSLTITNDTTFTGKFLLATQDGDADGMLDAYEWYNFNTISYGLNQDVDGDGLDIQTEIFRSYSPQAHNELVEGGISRRRSETLFFVPAPPDFTQQPVGITNALGNDLTLSFVPHGIGPFTYQWRLNGANIPGATNTTLTLTNAQPVNAGSFSAVISSPYGASNSIVVPVIVNNGQPDFILPLTDNFPGPLYTDASRTGLAWNDGSTRQPGEPFHADKPGTNSVWLHWRAPNSGVVTLSTLGSGFDTLLAVYTGSSVSTLTRVASDEDSGGFYTSALTFSATSGEDYYFAVDGLVGAQGHIILSWHLETSGDEVPRITAHPAGRTVAEGARVPLHVQVVSQATPSYQWFKNGAVVTNATRDKLILENVTLSDVGVYQVAVWIGTRTNWSEPASIQVNNRSDRPAKDKLKDLLVSTNDLQSAGLASLGDPSPPPADNRFALASPPPARQLGLAAATVNLSLGLPMNHTFNNFGSLTDAGEAQAGKIWQATDNLTTLPTVDGFLLVESLADSSEFAVVISTPTAGNLFAYTTVGAATNTAPGRSRLVVPVKGGTNYFITLCTTTKTPVQYTNTIVLLDGLLQIVEQPQSQVLPAGGAARLRVLASAQGAGSGETLGLAEESLTYVWKLNGNPIPAANSATYDAVATGNYTVTVSTPFTFVDSTVATVNSGTPVSITTPPVGASIYTGQSASLSVAVSGSGPVTYQWYRNNLPIPGAKGATHQIDDAELVDGGSYKVVISNPLNTLESAAVTLDVIQNHAPVFGAIGTQTTAEQQLYSLTVPVTDAEGPLNTLSFALAPGAPAGLTLNPTTGVIDWTPTEAQGPSANEITVIVIDNGIPNLSATNTFTLNVTEVNRVPILTAITEQTVAEGTLFSFTSTANDPDLPANTLTFTLAPGAPAGLVINPATGVIDWTPTEAQGPSANEITVIVTDNGVPALSATNTFTLNVTEVNHSPTLAMLPDRSLNVGETMQVTLAASDSDLPSQQLELALLSAPTNATLNSLTGLIQWTPVPVQGFTTNLITIRVTDNGTPPLIATNSFTVTVQGLPPTALPGQMLYIPETGFQFAFEATPGRTYAVEYSTNFIHWLPLTNHFNTNGTMLIADPQATNFNHRFYRSVLLPPE